MNHSLTVSRLPRVLTRWLAFGFAWLLLGMFLLPTSKLYQQGLILFFWLPGLLAVLAIPVVRRSWDGVLLFLFALSVFWAGLSIGWGGEPDQLKELLYVCLAVNAMVALAALNPRLLWQVLLGCALLGSGFAWWSLFEFYIWQGQPLDVRVVSTGLLNHTILASHVIGVIGLVVLFMRSLLPPRFPSCLWVVACLGCLAFLLMSRSKGPALALLVCMSLSGLWSTARWGWLAGGGAVFVALLAAWLLPEQLFRGGFSYRPQLLEQAWLLWQENPWLGLGVGADYKLLISELGITHEHAHNLYMHLAVQLGAIGVMLWVVLQAAIFWRAWSSRGSVAGQTLCALCCFSAVALLTDGIGPWVKPREEWFTVWLPVLLGFALYSANYEGFSPKSRVE
ncbi:Lipid A core--O-antigen ligase [Pseudomonas sp. 8BK]|uniref:O-antigen ligase family protein n=1 Tax=Pseudomonas sp. 8BK TaxID=2653164 RepID=UPI0012F0DECC|nr:O-antigen ligase family protein [Pseudomonas sp. 8BK]VXA97108.1 Lipid A core--O-antigen ligase [Pseudomonas sp. 8BK]